MPEPFDVYLSYHDNDKPMVRRLAEALKSRGLHVWFDHRRAARLPHGHAHSLSAG